MTFKIVHKYCRVKTYILKTNPTVELSKKKQALAVMKESGIACTATYQWNKLNTTMRMLVHKIKINNNIVVSWFWWDD